MAVAALLALSACAAPPRSDAALKPLRIASWNLEHLAEADGSGCKPRTAGDYAALRAVADTIAADVVAFQEVESEAAALRVFDPARYTIVMETRAGASRRSECRGQPGQVLNRQAVGFAIRKELEIRRFDDVTALQLGDPDLRSGVDIEVGATGSPKVRLLAVHLKSGCASGDTNEACAVFFRQIPVLEAWIDARAATGDAFLVLGDFNRRLAAPNDSAWADLDDGAPPASDLFLAADTAGPRCDPRFTAFIDHIAAPKRLRPRITGFHEWTYDGEALSDHCPISIALTPR